VPGCKSVRYAVNCKALSPHRPRIWDCHAGKKYPADAVYVGREVKDRRGKLIRAASPFGNPYLSPEEFRAYAEEKMKDAAFAGQVMALRGKDLLCWCRPHEADRCHARIWLELANAPKGETSVAAGAKATTTESQSITAAPNRPAVARKRKAPARKAYEHNPSFLTKEEADELYDMILKQEWTIKDDGRAQLTYGVSYDRGGPIPTEIPVIPDFLRRLADRVSEKTQYPVNFVQVHRFEPEHPVFPHYDPRGMCVPMITVGQERTFQVGDDGNSKSPSGKQQNRKVEDHSPESRILMRHGDLLVFTGNKVMHSMYPASKDEQFSPNGYDYRISILFRYTTEAMRKFGVGVCNRYGQEKQYRDAVRAFRARQATMAEEEKQKQISASDATEATTREQVISKAVCIDCVTGLDSLPEKSVACVVTSPPYNIGIKYGTHDDNRDDYLEWMQSVFVRIKRVLVDDGQFFLQVGGIPTNPLIYERVMRQALAAGFVVQNAIVWAKSIAIDDVTYGHFKPVNSNRFENNAHEHIFHLTKSGMVPLKGSSPFLEDTLWFIPYVTANKIKERPKHPAVFPIALPERCIQSSGVPKGSLVIDPFVGSGTTLIACEKLGMTGLGFDIDNAYVEYANRRLERLSRERRVEVGGERTEEAAEDGSQPDVCFSLEA
jgi:site-specific DNA-methyltransferase (adenine-specific)